MAKFVIWIVSTVLCPLVICAVTSAQTEAVLHQFSGEPDGAIPWSGLIVSTDHAIYGTAENGGSSTCADPFGQCGVIFNLTSEGAEHVIYRFRGGTDGAMPQSGLIADSSGNLYGTTNAGGQQGCAGAGCGTVFELRRTPTGWKERQLYRFIGEGDGATPAGPLTWGKDGNLYGTTIYGGNPLCDQSGLGCGTVFELKRSGSGWSEIVLHAFNSQDGAYPYAGVVFDSAGNLYGTTIGGGNGNGTVFELTPTGGLWTETTLYNFIGGPAEGVPFGGVIVDQEGNLFGTTEFSGDYGSGTVFELTQTGGVWTLTTLHSFDAYDGQYPRAGVVLDSSGNLYGTAFGGGTGYSCTNWCGVVFELQQGSWDETVLYNFQGGTDGAYPGAPLLLDTGGGAIYGTTTVGGNQSCSVEPPFSGCGVVFKIIK